MERDMTDRQVPEEGPVGEAATADGPQDFTEAEQRDLVRLMQAPLPEQRFVVPGSRTDDEYFVTLRMWDAEAAERFLNIGSQLYMDVSPRDKGAKRERFAPVKTDSVAQFRFLVERAVVDFRLAVGGKDYVYRRAADDYNWSVFRGLHPDVAEWVKDTIRRFLGLDEAGEASAGASKFISDTGGAGC